MRILFSSSVYSDVDLSTAEFSFSPKLLGGDAVRDALVRRLWDDSMSLVDAAYTDIDDSSGETSTFHSMKDISAAAARPCVPQHRPAACLAMRAVLLV